MKKVVLSSVLMALCILTFSQTTQQPQKKIALVIGNGNYNFSILANPENDAKAMKDALLNVGFSVIEYENLNQIQMKKAIDDFGDKLRSNEVGLFFYAGHGIQSKGYNYLIPVDAVLKSEEDVEFNCVEANRILAKMEASGSKVNIVILDACRNNPFERSWTRAATGRGLALMDAPFGTLIAYSTAPGKTASDGSGKNSPYTSAILESIKIPNITIIQMFQNVRSIVSQKSSKQQIPWESTSMTGDFYLNTGENTTLEIQKKVQGTPTNEISKLDGRKNDSTEIQKKVQVTPTNEISKLDEGKNDSTEIQKKIQVTPTNEISKLNERDYIIDSRDNERYKIVKIGTQIWMAENLKTTKYRNRDLIGTTTPVTLNISGQSNPKYQWAYEGNENNVATYGRLYTWYAVTDSRNICPTGWHVPTDAEWTILTDYLTKNGYVYPGSGSDIGKSIANTSGWTTDGTVGNVGHDQSNNNRTGFTALPSGYFGSIGTFREIGSSVNWWSSTEVSVTDAYSRNVAYDNSGVRRYENNKRVGFSVRCLRDN
jgi:uncharacterized protein (TIGR02145 family)